MHESGQERHQAGTTLTAYQGDILEACAFVDETSVAGIVRPLIETYLAERATDPAVIEAMEARSEQVRIADL